MVLGPIGGLDVMLGSGHVVSAHVDVAIDVILEGRITCCAFVNFPTFAFAFMFETL